MSGVKKEGCSSENAKSENGVAHQIIHCERLGWANGPIHLTLQIRHDEYFLCLPMLTLFDAIMACLIRKAYLLLLNVFLRLV